MEYEYVKIYSDPADKFRCIEITPKTLGTLLNEYSDEVHNKRETRIPYDQWKTLSSIVNDPKATIQVFKLVIYCEYSVNNEKNCFYIRANESPFVSFSIKQVYADIEKLADKWNLIDNFQQEAIINSCSKDFKDTLINKSTNKTERKDEEMKGFNFDFGACKNDNIRMSVYGLAVKNTNDEWVSYDKETGKIFNVDIFNFDGRNYFYKLPVAIKDVKTGDVIIHQRVPMFVVSDITDNKVVCIDPRAGEEKIVIPTASPFGFDFVTKVVSIFDMSNLGATSDTPFGNMLPFMMMMNQNNKV